MPLSKLAVTLLSLEADNSEDWTTDGQPRLSVVSESFGDTVTREMISAEGFSGLTKATIDKFRTDLESDEDFSDELDDLKKELNCKIPLTKAEAFEQAKASFKLAQKEVAEANAELKKASLELDKFIAEEEKARASMKDADSIKAFQKSQLEQRVARNGRTKEIADFLASKAK